MIDQWCFWGILLTSWVNPKVEQPVNSHSPLFALACILITGSALLAQEKPNIIVIMADDLGFGDVSCNGATRIQTPNIDQLAREGRRFTSGYTTASTCTPTRYSFLTGAYAFRTPNTGVAPPNAPLVIPSGTETIASQLKRGGYCTAVIGKWHLGLGEKAPDWNNELKPGPLELGFDHCFILPTTNDRVPQVYVENHRVRKLDPKDPLWVGSRKPSDDHPTGITERAKLRLNWSIGHNDSVHNGIGRIGFYTGGQSARFRDEDMADDWIRQANGWMEQQRDQTFFLFFASHSIHVPRMPHERFQKQSNMGLRGDAILEFDWQVGEIMKTVDRLKLSEKTLIVVCSDNGPVLDDGYQDGAVEKLGGHMPSGPYRGGKYSVFEGGTRTPFIVRWKGRIQPAVSDAMVSTMDLASSMAALAKVTVPAKAFPDSFNVLGALLGEAGASGREYLVQQDNNLNNFGLRVGSWKLVRQKIPAREREKNPQLAEFRYQLFDLAGDVGEQKNVAAEQPERVAAMRQQLERVIKSERTRPE